MGKIRSILVVCTGNTCRSAMAEGLLREALRAAGKGSILIRSAGIQTLEGMPPTNETVKVMRAAGIDISGHRSQELTDELINEADLILVMEERHRDAVLRRVPSAADKTHLLRRYGLPASLRDVEDVGVPDPIGKPLEYYEYCLKIIKKQVERIAAIV